MKDMTYVQIALDKISPIDLAWLCGFYEGEGSCGFYVSKTKRKDTNLHTRRIIMSIGQRERDVLEHIVKIVGFGHIGYQANAQNIGRPSNRYECSGDRAVQLLKRLLPHMKSPYKISQVQNALHKWENRPGKVC